MSATLHSLGMLREAFQDAGGVPLWKTVGQFGLVECWLVGSELRIVHRLVNDGGVDVYKAIAANTFPELMRIAIPGERSD